MTAKRDFVIPQGTDWKEDFQILDGSGNAIDLTGYSLVGEARTGEAKMSPVAFAFVFNINYSERRVYVSVPRGLTSPLTPGDDKHDKASTLFYDFKLISPDDTVDRPLQGKVYIDRAITQ